MECPDKSPLNHSDDENDILPEARIFDMFSDNIVSAKSAAYEAYLGQVEKEEKENTGDNEEREKNTEVEAKDFISQVEEKIKKKTRGKKKQKQLTEDNPDEVVETAPRRSRRKRKELDSKEIIAKLFQEDADTSPSQLKLPSVAKKRIKELRLCTAREKQRVDEENRRVLDSDTSDHFEEEEAVVEVEKELTLRIRYMSDISRISVPYSEKFCSIVGKIASLFQLKASEILLCLQDENIDLSDSPKSLNLNITHIIDCFSYKPSESAGNDPNMILLRLQSSDSRKKVDLYTHKLEPLSEMMQRYADQRELPLASLHFEFDGERIRGTETTEDLDMESGSCVDVQVTKSSPEKDKKKGTKAPSSPEILDVFNEDDYPVQGDVMQIVMLD